MVVCYEFSVEASKDGRLMNMVLGEKARYIINLNCGYGLIWIKEAFLFHGRYD